MMNSPMGGMAGMAGMMPPGGMHMMPPNPNIGPGMGMGMGMGMPFPGMMSPHGVPRKSFIAYRRYCFIRACRSLSIVLKNLTRVYSGHVTDGQLSAAHVARHDAAAPVARHDATAPVARHDAAARHGASASNDEYDGDAAATYDAAASARDANAHANARLDPRLAGDAGPSTDDATGNSRHTLVSVALSICMPSWLAPC